MGMPLFAHSQSSTDVRKGIAGSRQMFWNLDLKQDPDVSVEPQGSFGFMTDVDYYVDMNAVLTRRKTPFAIYTLIPETAAFSGEGSYTFTEDQEISYVLAGGATYQHPLWDYAHDNLTTRHGNWCTAYSVVHKRVAPNRAVVVFVPIMSYPEYFDAGLGGAKLQALRPVTPMGTVVIDCVTPTGVITSLGRVNSAAHAEITRELYDTVHLLAATQTSRLSRSALAQPIAQEIPEGKNKTLLTAIILDNLQEKGLVTPARVVRVADATTPYQMVGASDYDPEATPSCYAVASGFNGSPLGCFVPVSTPGTHRHSANERVVKFQEPYKDVVRKTLAEQTKAMAKLPSDFVTSCMLEFVGHLKKDLPKERLTPWDAADVEEKQCKPSQIAAREQGGSGTTGKTKVFNKKEPYADAKPNRVISQLPEPDKQAYACFILALGKWATAHWEWYAFGRTPKGIAQRVADLLSTAKSALMTDLSRFDGRVSPTLRQLEGLVLAAMFPVKYAEELYTLHGKQFGGWSYFADGTCFPSGWARESGSMETGLLNTVDNAFIAYLGFRHQGYTSAAAYAALGVYGGDDGMTPDADPEQHIRAAKNVGQVLKPEIIREGEPGVNFLARIYGPGVWSGDSNSMYDPLRFFTKIHIVTQKSDLLRPVAKMCEKFRAILLTDPETPVLSDIAKAYLAKWGDGSDKIAHTWWSDYDVNERFPNNLDQWMLEVVDRAFPDLNTIALTGFYADPPAREWPALYEREGAHALYWSDLTIGGMSSTAPDTFKEIKKPPLPNSTNASKPPRTKAAAKNQGKSRSKQQQDKQPVSKPAATKPGHIKSDGKVDKKELSLPKNHGKRECPPRPPSKPRTAARPKPSTDAAGAQAERTGLRARRPA
jgi:hypothetical protein